MYSLLYIFKKSRIRTTIVSYNIFKSVIQFNFLIFRTYLHVKPVDQIIDKFGFDLVGRNKINPTRSAS